MADIITEAMRDLRRSNRYDSFLFDKAQLFLKGLYADKRIAPKGPYSTRLFLLFACGQGFLTGYGAAVDHEYDEGMPDVAAEVAGADWWTEMLRLFEGAELRPFTLPRASLFLRTALGHGVDDPALYYMGYGFISGFEQALDQAATGEVAYLTGKGDDQQRFEDFVRRASRVSAYDAVMRESMRAEAVFDDDDDEFDDEYDGYDDEEDDAPEEDDDDHLIDADGRWDVGYLDGHWDEETDELGDVGGLVRDAADATQAYTTSTCEQRSGFHSMPEQILLNRAHVYASHYVTGFCVRAFGDIGEGDAERILAVSEGDMFSGERGADRTIERDAELGRLAKEDVPLARAYVRNFFGTVCREYGIDRVPTPEEWERLEIPFPYPTDDFWAIAGVGFANGARKAADEGRHVSARAKMEYQMLRYGYDLIGGLWDGEDE